MGATIKTWTSIIKQFSPVFTVPTFQVFVSMMTGWILCTIRRTTTGIIPFADPQRKRPHDAFHRIFPNARWATSELWRLLPILLVAVFYPTGIIILYLDDTVFHRSGRKVHGASWHRDAVRSTGTKIVYLLQKKNNRKLPKIPWYPHKPHPSFQDALACLRRVLWKERIKVLFGKTSVHDKVFEFLIEALASAA